MNVIINFLSDGKNQADCKKIDSPEGAQEAASCSEDRQEVSSPCFRGQEAAQVQAWHSCPEGDQKIPEKRK